MSDKSQIFKCSTCHGELDEATDTIFWSDDKPFCICCYALNDELPREDVTITKE